MLTGGLRSLLAGAGFQLVRQTSGGSEPPAASTERRWKPFSTEGRVLSLCAARKRLSRLQVSGLRGRVIAVISFRGELWLKQEMSRRAICSPQTPGNHGFSFSFANRLGSWRAGKADTQNLPIYEGSFPTFQSQRFLLHYLNISIIYTQYNDLQCLVLSFGNKPHPCNYHPPQRKYGIVSLSQKAPPTPLCSRQYQAPPSPPPPPSR